LPWLYLKGISTGDFSEAMAALLGKNAKGLSAGTISRLKQCWFNEYMVYKLGLSAEKGWRKLRGFRRLADVINGVKFIDGVDEETFERQRNAA
jgi:hypothetical protein